VDRAPPRVEIGTLARCREVDESGRWPTSRAQGPPPAAARASRVAVADARRARARTAPSEAAARGSGPGWVRPSPHAPYTRISSTTSRARPAHRPRSQPAVRLLDGVPWLTAIHRTSASAPPPSRECRNVASANGAADVAKKREDGRRGRAKSSGETAARIAVARRRWRRPSRGRRERARVHAADRRRLGSPRHREGAP